jgi:hypothetical protein
MNRFAPVVIGGAVLALGLCFLTSARGRDDAEDKKNAEAAVKASPDVLKLADNLGAPAALQKQADLVAKNYQLEEVMWQLKPRANGGVGMGKPGAFNKADGIEIYLLQVLSMKLLTKGALTEKAADLQRAAEIMRGIGEVTPKMGAKFTVGDKAKEKKWAGYAAEMQKDTDDLIAAIKAKDPDPRQIQKIATALSGNCNDCHTEFRDK